MCLVGKQPPGVCFPCDPSRGHAQEECRRPGLCPAVSPNHGTCGYDRGVHLASCWLNPFCRGSNTGRGRCNGQSQPPGFSRLNLSLGQRSHCFLRQNPSSTDAFHGKYAEQEGTHRSAWRGTEGLGRAQSHLAPLRWPVATLQAGPRRQGRPGLCCQQTHTRRASSLSLNLTKRINKVRASTHRVQVEIVL